MASTPLPPDNGEHDHASELASLRLHDLQRLDQQRIDDSVGSSPEASTPAPPNDGVNGHSLSPRTRLSDAEDVALERLDGAAEGSLQEALAIAPANASPRAASSLVDRIELAGDDLAPEPAPPPLDAKPAEASHQASEAAPAPEPSPAAPAEGSGAINAVESVAAPGPPVAEGAADGGLSAEPAETLPAPAGDRSPIVPVVQTEEARAPASGRPLASALDAAAKLAADANAAAAALENLKRLLERQLPNVAAGNAPRPLEAAAREVSVNAPAAPAPLPPPVLPLHAVRDGSGRSTLRHAVLAPPPPPRRAAERLRLDVRGFLAGFALSWAFGIVLYLLMTAG
jgi:hypothetical protein